MRLFRIDDPEHAEASALLAWYANGTLEPAERARVERHLRECVACSREAGQLRRLDALLRSEAEHQDRLAGAMEHTCLLSSDKPAARMRAPTLRDQWRCLPAWARAALVLQPALLVLLAVTLFAGRPGGQVYRTLSAPARASAGDLVVVVFDAQRPERELRALLQRLSARIVDGPDAAGAYALRLVGGREREALAALRSDPRVVLAEPAPAGWSPPP
jgi:anti-sigma factor RsiW